MNKSETQKLKVIKDRLVEGMTDYLADGDDVGYAKADIKKCEKILQQFITRLGRLGASATDEAILNCVKQAVLDLNTLNDSANGCLIETDQREDLCEYLLLAAKSAGLNQGGDITKAWREW